MNIDLFEIGKQIPSAEDADGFDDF